MTGPGFRYRDYEAELGVNSAVYQQEWAGFLQRRKTLIETILGELQATGQAGQMMEPPPGEPPVQPAGGLTQPGQPRTASRDQLVGQARFWGIPGAEEMDAQQLFNLIEQARSEAPRTQETSAGSAAAALAGAWSAGWGSMFRLGGNVAGLVDKTIKTLQQVGFGDLAASQINNAERAKNWLYDMSRATEGWVEQTRLLQPAHDRVPTEIAIATGKVAGYAVPSILAFQALGAMWGTSGAPSILGRAVHSPMLRAEIQGALAGALLEVGSDEPLSSKVMSIGLGTILGLGTAVPRVGASLGGAAIGGSIGYEVDGQRGAAIGLVAGALLPAAPLFLGAAAKVRGDMPGPFDLALKDEIARNPTGSSQGPRKPTTASARMGQAGELPPGADYSVDQSQLQVRSTPPIEGPEQLAALQSGQRITDPRRQLMGPMDPQVAPEYTSALGAYRRELETIDLARQGDDPAWNIERLQRLAGESERRLGQLERGSRLTSIREPPPHLAGTKVVDQLGQPVTVYHGTGLDFEEVDMSKMSPESLFGPGYYTTENQEIASGYAGAERLQAWEASVENVKSKLATYRETKRMMDGAGLPSEQIDGWIAQTETQLAEILANPVSPNVRPARLLITKPFDIDKTYSSKEMYDLVNGLEKTLPEYDWETSRTALAIWHPDEVRIGERVGEAGYGQYEFSGEEIYNTLTMTAIRAAQLGPRLQHQTTSYDMHTNTLGKAGFNRALEAIGYDGITHTGGARTGNEPHRVWIAFRSDQVHSPWDVPALDERAAATQGQAISKQASVMESPGLPGVMGKVKVGDSDVVEAMYAANPAGVSVIKGIDPFTPGMSNIAFSGQGDNVRFIPRPPNKLDVLVGDGLTDKTVGEYMDYGMFTGQRVSANGHEGTVMKLGAGKNGDLVIIARESGPPIKIRQSKVLPSRFGAPVRSVPDMWNSFKADLLLYMTEESGKVGMPPVLSMYDPKVPGLVADRMQDFLDRLGMNEPAARQAVEEDFNRRWVEDYRSLDGEMRALQSNAVDEATRLSNEVEVSSRPDPISLEELAEQRGFTFVASQGQGGTFIDATNPGQPHIPVQTDEGAYQFLLNVDRQLPDLAPASDVPFDVAEVLPLDTAREPRSTFEDLGDSLDQSIRSLNSGEDTGGGAAGPSSGGGAPPRPPTNLPPSLPPGDPSGEGWDAWPRRIGGKGDTLGAQFARFLRADPAKYAELVQQFQGLVDNKFRYMRYQMLNVERRLTEAGFDMGRAWEHFEALATARTQAFNESYPWLNQYGAIMREFPRRVLREGHVTRIHEIEDHNARMAAFWRLKDSHGYSDDKIKQMIGADEKLTGFMHRFFEFLSGDPAFALRAEREIFRYMPHVRARQAQGVADPYDTSFLSPEVQFFGEFAREGNLQFRIMDARELGNYMVRSAMFKKHEAGAWQQLVETWQDPRVPKGLQDFMMDYARLSRYGYDARGELAVRGTRKIFETLGFKMSSKEASHLLNMPGKGMYMALLAGRTSIFFRDAMQPLLALAKVRAPYMRDVMGDVLKGVGQKLTLKDWTKFDELYQRGLKGGWIERENPNLEAAGMFEETAEVGDLGTLNPVQAAIREGAARVGDFVYELPHWLVRPSESNVSTLKWYARQGQLHRLIVGESAYRQATQSLGAYRRSHIEAALERNPAKATSYDTLAEDTFFSSFEPPIQRKLKELVDGGDDDGAAMLFAREVANWSQHRFGRKEVPKAIRGFTGRMLGMFGNFSGQFAEGAYSGMRWGTPRHKARFGMTVGAVTGALYAAEAYTGWKFGKWAWTQALGYMGGPWMETVTKAGAAGLGVGGEVVGRGSDPSQRSALRELVAGMPELAVSHLPYTGYIRSFDEYARAAQGMNPWEQAARFTVTGDRGSRIDMQRALEEAARRQGGHAPGDLSPSGGLMPGRPGADLDPNSLRYPRSQYPQGTSFPGAGGQQ